MSAGIIYNNTTGLTATAVGNSGEFLQSNGAGSAPTFAAINLTQISLTPVSTTPYVALTTDVYLSVNTGTAKTIQLPNAPSSGRYFVIKDLSGTANTNNITVTTVGGAVLIDGSTSYTINLAYGSAQFIFNGTSYEVF